MKKRIPLCLLSVPIVLLAIFLVNTPSLFAMTPQSGGTLRLSMNVDIKSLDPHQIGWQNHEVLRQIYEGILAVGRRLSASFPGLAHKWDVSADGLVYTFHMRERGQVPQRQGDDRRRCQSDPGSADGLKHQEQVRNHRQNGGSPAPIRSP